MGLRPGVSLDQELELYSDEEQNEALKKITLAQLDRKRLMAEARKRIRELRGKPVIFGLMIGVVIGQVDEYENITIAHGFSRKTPKARIRWARETNAMASQVQPFDENANIDVDGIPVPNSRKRTPEMERHERQVYKQQIALALEFRAQWAERQVKLTELRKKQRQLEQQLDDEDETSAVQE